VRTAAPLIKAGCLNMERRSQALLSILVGSILVQRV